VIAIAIPAAEFDGLIATTLRRFAQIVGATGSECVHGIAMHFHDIEHRLAVLAKPSNAPSLSAMRADCT